MKWFNSLETDKGIVLTSRVRLARNLQKFPFPSKITSEQANQLYNEVKLAILNDRTPISNQYEAIRVDQKDKLEKMFMVERHMISPVLAAKNQSAGLLLKEDETVAIMINEEDHIRIQTIRPYDSIESAWDEATKIDDLLEETLVYAFSPEVGYLTACPTNVGTGLRASYMVHIPILESSDQLKNIIATINKFGITVRGVYGEGTESFGGIYQISNQFTLGKSETEIIGNLKNIVNQIVDKESIFRDKIVKGNRNMIEDKVYRALGLVQNARRITSKEAMTHLSDIRLGMIVDILKPNIPQKPTYEIMIGAQAGNIMKKFGESDKEQRDINRAQYLRECFKEF